MCRDGMSRGRGDLFLNLFLTLSYIKIMLKIMLKNVCFSYRKIIQHNYNKRIKTENAIYVYNVLVKNKRSSREIRADTEAEGKTHRRSKKKRKTTKTNA